MILCRSWIPRMPSNDLSTILIANSSNSPFFINTPTPPEPLCIFICFLGLLWPYHVYLSTNIVSSPMRWVSLKHIMSIHSRSKIISSIPVSRLGPVLVSVITSVGATWCWIWTLLLSTIPASPSGTHWRPISCITTFIYVPVISTFSTRITSSIFPDQPSTSRKPIFCSFGQHTHHLTYI